MSIRSVFSAVLWLVPAIVMAACASSSNPAEEVNRPSSEASNPGAADETLPVLPTAASNEDYPVPTSLPSVEPLQAAAPLHVVLPDLGPAPDITNEVWLNTDRPLNLATLRGRVVLVEFWTFG